MPADRAAYPPMLGSDPTAPLLPAVVPDADEAAHDVEGLRSGSAAAAPGAESPAVTDDPAPAADHFPCSIAQERLWLLDRVVPGNAALNIAFRWALHGRVDRAMLETAWRQLIERHEILRTVFPEIDSKPQQQVLPQLDFRLVEHDLSSLDDAARAAESERLAQAEARGGFDLASGPLLRATLLRMAPEQAVMLVTAHQIIADGWSMGILARELGLCCEALAEGRPAALEALPLQYADYSEWHLAWMAQRGTAAEDAWWTNRLAGFRPFRLPADLSPAAGTGTARGAIVSRTLPAAVMVEAQALAARHGATLFAVALAALTAVLHRCTGETDIAVGMLVADREQVELEGLVGQFVNALILRSDLSGDPGFAALVERARDVSAEALEHRHIPIERLLSIAGNASRDPQSALISVNFVFQRSFIEPADHGVFRLSDLPSLPTDPLYDLTIYLVEEPHGWQLTAQYDDSLYQRPTIELLLGHLERLLDHGCRKPALALSALPMLSPDERRLLQSDGPDQQAFPSLRGLQARFAAQVLARPDDVAVRCAEQTLTTLRLDGEAGRLAGHLQSLGVGPGSRVGICLRRSLDLPVALLALLRLGASWVILDPEDTRFRIGLIVESARLAVVIVRGGQWALLPGRGLIRVDLDADARTIAAAPPPPTVTVTPDREACAYPCTLDAGRMSIRSISHAAMETALMALARRPGLGAGETLIATTPPSHEFAAVDLLLPLLVGARLEIADDEALEHPEQLLRRIGARPGIVLPGTPPLLARWLASPWEPGMRVRVWCHGERPGDQLARKLLGRCSEVWTLYDPPGAAICAAYERLTRAEDVAVLGSAIPGTQLRVLGTHRELLPVGAIGELHVGGVSLPLGTDTAPALADQLVDAGDVGAAGARLLRTGDLARVRNDGRVVWVGRKDRRVQVNGRWIEPAEVEEQLLRHPNVAEAAVAMARAPENPDGEPLLTAWLVLAGDQTAIDTPAAGTLLDAYAARLHVSQRPSRLVIVETLPKAPDGTIDWRRLLRSDRPAGASGDGSTDRIERIAALWSELLGRDDIGADDHFFELGGHSLLAARMLRRVEQDFGRRVDLAALFAAPTARGLAELLGSRDSRDFDFRQVVRLQPNGNRLPMIAINNTGVYYLLARRLGQDQPVTSLQLFDPALGVDAMPDSIEDIAERYVQLILRVQPEGPYQLMGWCVAGALAFETARQLQASGHPVAHLYLMDAWAPNYLHGMPWLRRVINDRSLRLRHLIDDFRHQLSSGRGFGGFIANRPMVRRVRRWLGLDGRASGIARQAPQQTDPAGYDRWLLDYLQTLSNRYQPKPFDGPITLFRSREEPTGLWFDPLAGWGRHARGGIHLEMVEGDHFSMFRDPGASQMANTIRADHPD